MSKTLARSRASSSVSRSKRSVARPASFRTSATRALRGLERLLPLPCANTTIPSPSAGATSDPGSTAPSAGITTSRRISG